MFQSYTCINNCSLKCQAQYCRHYMLICGKRPSAEKPLLFPSSPNPNRNLSGASPGTGPHPLYGTSSLDSSSGCQPGARKVQGPWSAQPPSPASHMALWSALCSKESKEKMPWYLKIPPLLTTKFVTSLFQSPAFWANCAYYSGSRMAKHTPHWSGCSQVYLFCVSMFFPYAL